jgi:hypothetical protein
LPLHRNQLRAFLLELRSRLLDGLAFVRRLDFAKPDGSSRVAAERGFQQANGITLTESCRCNNSSGDNFAHHVRLADVLKLFDGGFEDFTHRRNCLRCKRSR